MIKNSVSIERSDGALMPRSNLISEELADIVYGEQIGNDETRECKINTALFASSVKSALHTIVFAQLAELGILGIQDFGYRRFLSDGSLIGFSTRNFNSSSLQNVRAKNAQGENVTYDLLRKFYNHESQNNFVFYKQSKDKIEGFYFLTANHSTDIVATYLNHLENFRRFTSFVSSEVNKILDSIRSNHSCHTGLYTKVLTAKAVEGLFTPNPFTKIVNNRYHNASK